MNPEKCICLFGGAPCFCDMKKHLYILGSELITVDTRIYTLWTHTCFDDTYAISIYIAPHFFGYG